MNQQLVQLAPEDNAMITVTVENNTETNIRLQNRTVIGWLYEVEAILPCMEKATTQASGQQSETVNSNKVEVNEKSTATVNEHPKGNPEKTSWDPPVDLTHLTVALNSKRK